jgi:hypothetical protein
MEEFSLKNWQEQKARLDEMNDDIFDTGKSKRERI